MDFIDSTTTNALWAGILVETLSRLGLEQVVISPGSRSTPLAIAFARHNSIEAIPVLDERSASFFALGLAKKSHKPVALVCTSGTAAANYFPAVIEASESGVPLLVFTADRPVELRNCGAGQTIDQQKIYGNYPVHQIELANPDEDWAQLRYLRQTMVKAYTEANRGPVHVNCPFKDPLISIGHGCDRIETGIEPGFFEQLGVVFSKSTQLTVPIEINQTKGLIVCGSEIPADVPSYIEHISELSRRSGWPVLVDALSPVRNYVDKIPNMISCYDTIIRECNFADNNKPEVVVCLGPLPTSKVLRSWLSEVQASMFHFTQGDRNLDPTHSRTVSIEGDAKLALQGLIFKEAGDEDYLNRWLAAQSKLSATINEALNKIPEFEGSIAGSLPFLLPKKTPVFVANSMPIRDMEYFWPLNDNRHEIYFSRGANGIDGTLSTALGVAHGNRPSILLTGDLAFLHDSNGLMIAPKFNGHLTVLLINNNGGGIFNHLPVASAEDTFEEFFATPQVIDFKLLCESTGVVYVNLEAIDELPDYISELPESGIRVIEIKTDRYHDSKYRKDLFKTLSDSLT